MSSPLHLEVFVVPYKPIVGLVAPITDSRSPRRERRRGPDRATPDQIQQLDSAI
jgi:hypothetical protein